MKNMKTKRYAYIIVVAGIIIISGMFFLNWIIGDFGPVRSQKEFKINLNRARPVPRSAPQPMPKIEPKVIPPLKVLPDSLNWPELFKKFFGPDALPFPKITPKKHKGYDKYNHNV